MKNRTLHVFILLLLSVTPSALAAGTRPNMLWITIEDWSPDLSCYGTKGIDTPNADKYDFNKHGWPAWYPTRTLAEWEKARTLWDPYVFRKPTDDVPRPSIVHSKKKKKRK